MKTIIRFYFPLLIVSCLTLIACKKYLDKTPDKKLSIPRTVEDLQALMDNNNLTQNGIGLTDLGTDDYDLTQAEYPTKTSYIRSCYIWDKDIFKGFPNSDWTNNYQQIYTCNVVLEGLDKIARTSSNQQAWDFVKGHALFCRALFFYSLCETFGNPYKPGSASSDLGIPLRTTTSLEEPIKRASVEETFSQVLSDLNQAKNLLPTQIDFAHRNRPSQAAVFALMARVYLTMQKYDKANESANSCLALYSTLHDYNTLSAPGSSRAFRASPNDFDEIILQGFQINYGAFNSTTSVDSILYRSYNSNDLRLSILFGTGPAPALRKYFKGQYTGSLISFSGLATDEVYLIRAETFARLGNTASAMQDLNTLYQKRWKNTVPYVTLTATDANDALRQILTERRKELLFRGIRWSDLRRLNQDPNFAKTIVRGLTTPYSLPPNDPKYVYPIPDNEIQLSGIPQNPR